MYVWITECHTSTITCNYTQFSKCLNYWSPIWKKGQNTTPQLLNRLAHTVMTHLTALIKQKKKITRNKSQHEIKTKINLFQPVAPCYQTQPPLYASFSELVWLDSKCCVAHIVNAVIIRVVACLCGMWCWDFSQHNWNNFHNWVEVRATGFSKVGLYSVG